MRPIHWQDLPEAIDSRVALCRTHQGLIDTARKLAAYGAADLGYFLDEEKGLLAAHGDDRAIGRVQPLFKAAGVSLGRVGLQEASSGNWIKIAYSTALRRVGEALNFFPGTYPGGLPNHPSPLSAMLTSALVGSGLGYAGGAGAEWLGSRLVPGFEKGKLRRTLALAGGLGGASLAVPWAAGNLAHGQSLLSSWPFHEPPGTAEQPDPANFPPAPIGQPGAPPIAPITPEALGLRGKHGSAFGFGVQRDPTPFDVNVNALGQTLWQSGASPQLAGATMGAIYAAQQLPDEDADSDHVTGHQLGQLALAAGKGYVTGKLVGAALNAATGLPTSGWGGYGLALGVIGAVVPKLF